MKLVIVALVLLIAGCSGRMEQYTLSDQGRLPVAEGVYIKKISISSGDRVYLLVDENDRLVGSSVSTSITVRTGKSRHTESNALLSK